MNQKFFNAVHNNCLYWKCLHWGISVLAASLATGVGAAQWSSTEVHLQYGELEQAYSAGDVERSTLVLTLQHASGWQYGENFFFVDHLSYARDRAVNDSDELYAEWYSSFSLGKIFDRQFAFGPVKDVGLLAGVNFAAEVDTLYYLPGVRLAMDIPGFNFANLDLTAYIQESDLLAKEDDAYMVDFNWALPFSVGQLEFSFEGHIEYIDGADIEGGGERAAWVLMQPQLRFDVGHALLGQREQLFIGLEYQRWNNKLGDRDTDESALQALLVWRL